MNLGKGMQGLLLHPWILKSGIFLLTF